MLLQWEPSPEQPLHVGKYMKYKASINETQLKICSSLIII